MMKINEISWGMRNIEVEGEIVDFDEIRNVRTRYGETRVVNATLRDETGEIKLTLWGDQIDKVKKGDKVKIKEGYVRSFRGELFLNISRKGSIEVL